MKYEEKKKGTAMEDTTPENTSGCRIRISGDGATGLWLEKNGSYEFCDRGRTWVSGTANVPTVNGTVPEEITGRKTVAGTEEKAVIFLSYGAEEPAALTRTVEFCPETESFTVLDEYAVTEDGKTVTESLYSPYPIRLTGGSAVIDADGKRAEVLVRNQENLRVERQERSFENGILYSAYCLKWEIARGRTYTCCQVELKN